jgi:putative transposase
MKKSRFSDSQILAILKQAESGTPVANLCREYGMSNACFGVGRNTSNLTTYGRVLIFVELRVNPH